MKTFGAVAVLTSALILLSAITPSANDSQGVDDATVNAKVDARLRQVLQGMLRSQTEQALLPR